MRRLLADEPGNLRARIVAIYAGLLVFNAGAWGWALVAFHHYPVLLGTAFLAYSFGLRHAVDADHIAAIDNVTRKLMQEGKKPIGVGLLFSLGHSTVVVVGSLLIASTTLMLQHRLDAFRSIGGVIGTVVSTLFLFGIAILNLDVLRSVYAVFVRVRNGEEYVEEDMNLLLSGGGFLARVLRPVFARITESWHMYPLGMLFGLGFDTATEIGLLWLSAAEVAKGLPLWSVLVFPALFAAGMSLVDTTDNILMIGAYGWAFAKPIRKLYYNMTITLVSVVVAFVVGGIEALGLVAEHFRLQGWLWTGVRQLNEHFGLLGYCIVGFFLLSWVISVGFYKWRRIEEIALCE